MWWGSLFAAAAYFLLEKMVLHTNDEKICCVVEGEECKTGRSFLLVFYVRLVTLKCVDSLILGHVTFLSIGQLRNI